MGLNGLMIVLSFFGHKFSATLLSMLYLYKINIISGPEFDWLSGFPKVQITAPRFFTVHCITPLTRSWRSRLERSKTRSDYKISWVGEGKTVALLHPLSLCVTCWKSKVGMKWKFLQSFLPCCKWIRVKRLLEWGKKKVGQDLILSVKNDWIVGHFVVRYWWSHASDRLSRP